MRLRLFPAVCRLAAALLLCCAGGAAQAKDLLIFAAASLKNALDEIDTAFEKGGTKAVASYAASSALAKQIEAGAPADIFISADLDWMDYLDKKSLIRKEMRTDLLANAIVLVGSAKATGEPVEIGPDFALAAKLGDGRLAMADPASVPAGKYGKAALESLGLWGSVAQRVAPAENVRAALLLVARGEAPLGIVYATDAAAEPQVRIVGRFPEKSHPPIVYPAAILAGSSHPEAGAYLTFLRSPPARAAFAKQGFTMLE